MIKNCIGIFVASCIGLFVGTAQANTVFIYDLLGDPIYEGNPDNLKHYNASCTPEAEICIKGFFGIPAVLSEDSATGYEVGDASAENELAFLNGLLDDLGLEQETQALQYDSPAQSFTTDLEYFSIKQEDWTAYFVNMSGGSVTVEFETTNFSHWTGYGDPVPSDPIPIPAAAWLFGSALIGFVGIARRKKNA